MSRVDVQKVPRDDDRTLPIFAELDSLADRIRMQAYNLFARRGTDDGRALDDWLAAEREVSWPAAELAERDGELTLEVALAGFEPNEIEVTATPREIIVKAGHENRREGNRPEPKVQWSEFRSNNVFRRVELPAAVDVDKIAASYENGLLKIAAPKAELAERSKRIEISKGS